MEGKHVGFWRISALEPDFQVIVALEFIFTSGYTCISCYFGLFGLF